MEESAITDIAIGIAGAGRMGEAIAEALAATDGVRLAGVWVRNAAAAARFPVVADAIVSERLEDVVAAADVIVDFSLPEATRAVAAAAAGQARPLVCGVSGLGDDEYGALRDAASQVAVVYDRNMSLGIAVLDRLVRDAAQALGDDFDIEIRETHHVHKLDAPSGTALKLGEAAAEALGIDPAGIRYQSERRGEVLGDHRVIFRTPAEYVALEHSVTTRQVFAAGAIRAAIWAHGAAPGQYSMQDVLFN